MTPRQLEGPFDRDLMKALRTAPSGAGRAQAALIKRLAALLAVHFVHDSHGNDDGPEAQAAA